MSDSRPEKRILAGQSAAGYYFPIFIFASGMIAELSAFVFQYNLGKFNCLDELVSMVAAILMLGGGVLVLARAEYFSWAITAAGFAYLFSKGINVTRNIEWLNTTPIIGQDDIRSRMLENVTFVLGGMVLLVGFLRAHLDVYRARVDLAARNAALMQEIEERRVATAALAESEHKLQLIINQIPLEVFWKDVRSVYLGCNQRRAEAAGLTRAADIVGKTDFDLAWTHEEAEVFQASDRNIVEGCVRSHRVQRQRHNAGGRLVWVENRKVPLLDGQGNVAGVLGTSEDITERMVREAERARLATAIEQAAESVLITDQNGVIQYVNPAFESITGYGREEAVGRRPSLLKSGYHDHAFYEGLWGTLLRGGVWHGRLINRRKDGTLYEEDAAISPVRNESGAVINFVALKRDVTKEVAMERQLRQASKMEALGTLASGVAHDFRNLLSLVMGCSELLLRQLDEGHPARANIMRIQQAGQRGIGLIRQIQTFTRQDPQERQWVSVHKVVQEAIELLRSSIPPSIEIRSRLEMTSGVVYADPTQVHQVAVNLCTNAFQSIRQPSGWIEVVVEDAVLLDQAIMDVGTLPPGAYVCLSVSDNGQGMDAKTLQHIFDPFYTTKRPGEGTGLGLAIVHGIVVGSGGGIAVASSPGKGSSFCVYLPRQTCGEGKGEEAEKTPCEGTERVWLVDDEEELAAITVELLRDLGYRARYYLEGAAALRDFAAAPQDVDVVISDLIMPGIPGTALAKELFRQRPDLPIIFTTGGEETLKPEHVEKTGARELVMKPYSAHALGMAIRRALRGQ